MNMFEKITRRSFANSIKPLFLIVRARSTSTDHVPALVSCAELNKLLQKPNWHKNYRLLDATWDLDNRDYNENHFRNRIGCSKFFSFDECRDHTSPYPRMLPTVNEFEVYVNRLGISNNHHVFVYDGHPQLGIYSAARVWWMFRVFGHNEISVLDGGFKKWMEEGYAVETGAYKSYEKLPDPVEHFSAVFQPALLKHFEFMESNAKSKNPIQVIDARDPDRFQQFHIRGSISAPMTNVLSLETRCMKSKEEIKNMMKETGVDLNKDIISSCGSGVTACVNALAIYHATGETLPVYDGAIIEWIDKVDEDMIGKKK